MPSILNRIFTELQHLKMMGYFEQDTIKMAVGHWKELEVRVN
jgi:hypothetical protein